MSLPCNGIYVLRGEISTLMTTIKRGARWNTSNYQEGEQDNLYKQFMELKNLLINIEDLRLLDPNVFLAPFLEVIRSEETTGQITNLALSALNKFLSYGLIDPTHASIATTVENIADAVTHARFVGSDQASDGVVLMKIVQVLRTLMLSPEGSALTNESVCEVMLSCFRICFEPRLNELLRRAAEHALKDIILLLFMRLPQFAEERSASTLIKKLKMMANGSGIDATNRRRKSSKGAGNKTMSSSLLNSKAKNSASDASAVRSDEKLNANEKSSANIATTPNLLSVQKQSVLATTPLTPLVGNIVDMQGKFMQTPQPERDSDNATSTEASIETGNEHTDCVTLPTIEPPNDADALDDNAANDADVEDDATDKIETQNSSIVESKDENASTNPDANAIGKASIPSTTLIPYGLPCIRELLRFLITLINPLDKQNTDAMIHMGLSLLTIALEVGADSIGKYDTLLEMVKDDLCKNLFALLSTERLTIFASDLQVCFLLFESQRTGLKFHLEYYLNKLAEIIGSENPRIPYEIRELALDNLLQFLRIPSFAAELYINYDCNLYCTNLLEDLVKLLSKNSLSATQAIYSIHEISLDGLLTIVGDIAKNCLQQSLNKDAANTVAIVSGRHSHSRTSSNADKIIVESNVSSDLNATTSGGEDNSTIENIQNFIGSKNRSSGIATINESSINDSINTDIVTHEHLIEVKDRKRILTQGTELFNQRPDKGIQFLQENSYLNPQLDPVEVAHFLRENSSLDKKMIGEYISKKKNVESKILEYFVKSFNFADMRIDMALRQYLETFRLPGEAPLIFLVMEHFADHWHKMNNEPFADTDAAFSLAYAIIMLNMDQHNHNAKRLNIPMTAEDFQKNLRGVNGKGDFDQDMLLAIFNSIKNEEIIMPAEQTGLVRENYLWKVLLKRNTTKDGRYLSVRGSALDKDIFQLVWGPTLATLSYMFDRSNETTYHKSLIAFTMGAAISSNFMLHDDFNALILTLCKFTTLLNNLNTTGNDGSAATVPAPSTNNSNEIATTVQFGLNLKAQLAMKAVFTIVHKHGDCLRCDGWKNVIEVVLQLFKLKLLPKSLMEVEDFCEPSGKVTLILEKPLQKQEVGLFSSIYSYLASDGQRQATYEEQEIIKVARRCVKECQLDQIIGESKFLHVDALRQLIQCLLNWLKPPSAPKSSNVYYAEDITVFLLEFLVKVLIQNRDRLLPLWSDCRDQIYLLLLGSSSYGYNYLLLRTTVGLLKLAIYLMRNEELCPVVLQSLKMFLLLNPKVILKISKQISTGLYELLKTSAQNIHTEGDWDIVFTLLEYVGAGAIPADYEESITLTQAYQGAKSEGALSSGDDESTSSMPQARGYTSDSDISIRLKTDLSMPLNRTVQKTTAAENWIIVNKDADVTVTSRPTSPVHSLVYPCKLMRHSIFALVKCWDSLAFIVRNVAHITPYNFESCVKCIRTFVEASLNSGNLNPLNPANQRKHSYNQYRHEKSKKREHSQHSGSSSSINTSASSNYPLLNDSDDETDDNELLQRYETIAIQLLDLMHTLHTRTAQIFRWWAEESGSQPQCSALWALGWCPILQGIARLATDQRKQVRTSAVTCLQRALLVHDLQTLTGPEWESCFKQVLFPLLYDLLAEVPNANITASVLEESRMRTATIMSKVFLHHLTPLITLPKFNEIWLDVLDYIEKFISVGSDMLHEAMLESLKNMLLVMHSVRVFHNNDGVTHSPLWDLTWNRVSQFLPHLKEELFDKEPMLANRVQVNEQKAAEHPPAQQQIPIVQQQPHLPEMNQFVPAPITQPQQQPETNQLVTVPTLLPQVTNEQPDSRLVNPYVPLLVDTQSQSIVQQQQQQQNHMNVLLQSNPATTTNYLMQFPHSNVIQTSNLLPIDQPNETPTTVSHLPSEPLWNTSYAMSTNFMNGPVFSNIVSMSVTPSPPPLLEVDETLENINNEEDGRCVQLESKSISDISTTVQTDVVSNLEQKSSIVESVSDEPKVPMSHLIATNQYPSLNKIPPPSIAQSFAPIYIQPNAQQQTNVITNNTEELYNSYVNNPYNLTLNVEQTFSNSIITSEPSSAPEINTTTAVGAPNPLIPPANIFQSMNYFGSACDGAIPPGSEMLFGGATDKASLLD